MATRERNSRGRFTPSTPLDVRKTSEAEEAEKLIQIGPITFVLIHADWCGHCQTYKPDWAELENLPNRTANIMKVHHDMVDNIPSIKNAKIQGYPSVIKVNSNGKIEEYEMPGTNSKTNAVPNMRDLDVMKKEVTKPNNLNINDSTVSSLLPNLFKKISKAPMKGGALTAVSGAFLGAMQQAGPAALLLAAKSTMPKSKTYKSPKKSSRRASSRKNKKNE
jgi:thiol-disulfide isomerase/thioredoxin